MLLKKMRQYAKEKQTLRLIEVIASNKLSCKTQYIIYVCEYLCGFF